MMQKTLILSIHNILTTPNPLYQMLGRVEKFETAHIQVSLRKGDHCLVVKIDNQQNRDRR